MKKGGDLSHGLSGKSAVAEGLPIRFLEESGEAKLTLRDGTGKLTV
jgi:hypothetical protein